MNIKFNDNCTIVGDINGKWEKRNDSYIVDVVIDNKSYKGVLLRNDEKFEFDSRLESFRSPICKFNFDLKDAIEIINNGSKYGNAHLVGDACIVSDEEMGNVLQIKNENKMIKQNYLKLPEKVFSGITHRGFTICMWVKLDGNTIRYYGNSALFEANCGGYDRYPMTRISCNLFSRINSNGRCADATNISEGLKENVWHYVCYSVNTKEINVYLDGQVVSRESKDLISCFDNNVLSRINQISLGSGEIWGDSDVYNAKFKSLEVYDSTLAPEEINYIYRKEKNEYLNYESGIVTYNSTSNEVEENTLEDNNMNSPLLSSSEESRMSQPKSNINNDINIPANTTMVTGKNESMNLEMEQMNSSYRNNIGISQSNPPNIIPGNTKMFPNKNVINNSNGFNDVRKYNESEMVNNHNSDNKELSFAKLSNNEFNSYNYNNRPNVNNTKGVESNKYKIEEIDRNNYQSDGVNAEKSIRSYQNAYNDDKMKNDYISNNINMSNNDLTSCEVNNFNDEYIKSENNIGFNSDYRRLENNIGLNDEYRKPENNIGFNGDYRRTENNIEFNDEYRRTENNIEFNDEYRRTENNIGLNDEYRRLENNIGLNDEYRKPESNIDFNDEYRTSENNIDFENYDEVQENDNLYVDNYNEEQYNYTNSEPIISGYDTYNDASGRYVELGQDEIMRDENNYPVASTWILVDNKVYCTDENGKVRIGWFEYGDKWYHFNYIGQMDTGWLNDVDDKWYYLGEDGVKRVGWLEDANGKLYFLGRDGAMKTGWIKDYDENWYYFYSNGEMAVNTVIDGYSIGWNGVCSR